MTGSLWSLLALPGWLRELVLPAVYPATRHQLWNHMHLPRPQEQTGNRELYTSLKSQWFVVPSLPPFLASPSLPCPLLLSLSFPSPLFLLPSSFHPPPILLTPTGQNSGMRSLWLQGLLGIAQKTNSFHFELSLFLMTSHSSLVLGNAHSKKFIIQSLYVCILPDDKYGK